MRDRVDSESYGKANFAHPGGSEYSSEGVGSKFRWAIDSSSAVVHMLSLSTCFLGARMLSASSRRYDRGIDFVVEYKDVGRVDADILRLNWLIDFLLQQQALAELK